MHIQPRVLLFSILAVVGALAFRAAPPAAQLAVMFVFLIIFVWGVFVEPRVLVVKKGTLELPQWPARYNGLKLGIVGCLHAGAPHINESKLEQIVAEFNQQRPDIVFLLGDLIATLVIGRSKVSASAVAKQLARIEAPVGIFAVMGNHDYSFGVDRLTDCLEENGIKVLRNTNVSVETVDKTKIQIAGLDYPGCNEESVRLALNGIETMDGTIVIAHHPDAFPHVPSKVALMLASHTHGGQVRLPLFGPIMLPSRFGARFASGTIREDGHTLFVTSGVGTSILPIRFNTPPEIVVLTVKAGLPEENFSNQN